MKRCYLDANVLVYFKDESSPYHAQAISTLEKLVENKFTLYISPLVLDEFLYVLTYYLKQTRAADYATQLKRHLLSIFTIPNLSIVSPPDDKKKHIKVIDYIVSCSLRPRDAYHLLTMKEHKIKYFATFDTDFDQLFEKDVLKRVRT